MRTRKALRRVLHNKAAVSGSFAYIFVGNSTKPLLPGGIIMNQRGICEVLGWLEAAQPLSDDTLGGQAKGKSPDEG